MVVASALEANKKLKFPLFFQKKNVQKEPSFKNRDDYRNDFSPIYICDITDYGHPMKA